MSEARHNPVLAGQTAVITGGASGIGKSIVQRFLEAGANCLAADLNEEALAALKQELAEYGDKLDVVKVDVSSRDDVDGMVDRAVQTFGQMDIIVNNAGWGCKKPLVETDEVSFDRSIALNLKATYFMTQIAAKQMIQQGHGGRIINISSTGALQGERNSSIYAATKAGIMALSRAAALELGPSGITINCVLPGFTRTNNNCHVPHTIDESFIPITPTGRVTVAQDIANACLFFAGEEAAQITAQCLPVDGGFSGTRAVQVAWNASMERK